MTRRRTVAGMVLGCIALGLVIVIAARLSAAGGRTTPVLTSGPAGSPPVMLPAPAAASCVPGPAARGTSDVQLSGACTGELTSAFGCVAIIDDLYLSGRRMLDPAHVLYLTVNVESYHQRPGDFAAAQAVLQLTGPTTVERWSNYTVALHVNADHSVRLPSVDLAADPGTGASGTVTVSGSLNCGAP